MSALPLSDITVIEVADGIAGAFCGRMLAAFGARVVKVERPPLGDWTRWAEPQLEGFEPPEAGALYLYNNMGKQSVTIDWLQPDGMAALRNLIGNADVLIDDWTGDTRRSPGLRQRELLALNDSLISLSLTPFGLSGPYHKWSSTPLVSLAMGGYLYLSGDESREPLMLPGYQSQCLVALQGYAGVMMALGARDRHGGGQAIEVSEMESLVSLHQFTIVSQTYDGAVRRRAGVRLATGRSWGGYPITTLPCADGFVTFSASAPHQWESVCAMIGREDLLSDKRFSSFRSLKEIADDIDDILLEWVKDKTRREIVELAAGTWAVPASPVLSVEEALRDQQYRERGLFERIEHPQGGALVFPGVPFHMSASPPRFGRAPTLGEHNRKYAGQHPRKAITKRPDKCHQGNLLDGVRVIDLTRVWAGPLAGRIMGDFGAHVIKVSDPRVPMDRSVGTNNKLNRNKDSLAIRLDKQTGRAAFLELVSVSDIVMDSFRPRVMRNFDLGYDELRKARPDIIMCSLSGYGSDGPHAEYPAYGTSVESITGLPSLMGYEDGSPMTSGIAFPDPVTALNSLAAILTALRHRTLTGEGQFIDLALAEGPVCQIGEFVAACERDGGQPERRGNTHYMHAPYGVYRTAGEDRWIAISVTTDAQWKAFCRVVGRCDLTDDPRFASAETRKQNERALNERISAWTMDKASLELMNDLQSAGVPAGAAHDNRDLLSDPHLKERGFYVELDEPDVGVKTYPGQAIRAAGMDRDSWTPSARLGMHNIDLLNGLLGLPSCVTSEMEREKVIGSYLDIR